MPEKEIIIRIENEYIFFNDSYSISFNYTNFPRGIKFKTHVPIYWKVEMVEFSSKNKTLMVNIKDYHSNELERFLAQNPKNEIRFLRFSGYDWQQLEPQLMVYYTKSFPEQIAYRNQQQTTMGTFERTAHKSFREAPYLTEIKEEFFVDFDDATFEDGYITFTKYIKKLNQLFEFIIVNEHFLSAFNNIKGWFVKKLKKKRFHVTAMFTNVNFQVQEFKAQSEEISSINNDFIDRIKVSRTISISERPKLKTEQTLFTKDELFSVISPDGLEENVFGQSEEEIINLLAEKFNVRNKPQLQFLSTQMQAEDHPIRYTLYPDFGFLFTIVKNDICFFVWELLNSHATYVWEMKINSNTIVNLVTTIEREISLIKTIKRDSYKKKNLIKTQEQFCFKVIYHNKPGAKDINDFEKWKQKLDDITQE